MLLARDAGATSPKLVRDQGVAPLIVCGDTGCRFAISVVNMDKEPDEQDALGAWMDQQQALDEGWRVIDVGGRYLEIQMGTSAWPQRPTDEADFGGYVVRRAEGGSTYHMQALQLISAENQARWSKEGAGGWAFAWLRSWNRSTASVESKIIIRLHPNYDFQSSPYEQDACPIAVGSNQDVVELDESGVSPDVTWGNTAFDYKSMDTIFVDDYPSECQCHCGARFPIDPCTEENLKSVIIRHRLVNVTCCPECGALGYTPEKSK